jgi:hypothetical protein
MVKDGKIDYFAVGAIPDPQLLSEILDSVKSNGSLLLLKFDAKWAAVLYERGILTKPVSHWGGAQSGGWNGNGWGYLDHFVGDQASPSGKVIGTSSWEVPGDPTGFWPLESVGGKRAYGAYVARPAVQGADKDDPLSLLILIGVIDHGKGKIILDAAYQQGGGATLNDMLFFNMIRKGCRGSW